MISLIETLEDRRLLSGTLPLTPIVQPPLPPITVTPLVSTLKPVPVTAEATDPFTATVATMSNTGIANSLILRGTINWGDGTATSAASFVRVPNTTTIRVLGSHTYAKSGKFTVSVSVFGSPFIVGPIKPPIIINLGSVKTTATIRPDDDGGVTLTETAGKKFTAVLGFFDFVSIDLLLSAKIDWGDGTGSVGSLSGGLLAHGEWNVSGTHTYAKAGTYKVHIIVQTRLVGQTLPSGTAADFFSTIKVVA
jgi:hypothetical protein